MSKLRIVLAQLNLIVGDIQGNLIKLIEAANHARDSLAADIIVFPELSITGYPPEDLLFRHAFIQAAEEALLAFKSQVKDIYCVVGHPAATNHGLFNACSLIYNGDVIGFYAKQHLPNYGVFDEVRYFIPGHSPCVVNIKDIPVALMICEDLWFDQPIQQAAKLGARLVLSPNASPFEIEKHEQRQLTLAKRATLANLPIVYVNRIGGQDEFVFDGGSMVVDASGKVCQHAGFFNETLLAVDFEFNNQLTIESRPFTIPSIEERAYQALVMGVRDYVHHTGFSGAVIGVSGGIDSALTLAIAVDALGKDNVSAVLLPSRYTADMSNEDAISLANNLGVKHEIISIEPVFNSLLQQLKIELTDKPDISEQNLQSRCRGVILMAISNRTDRLVLTTGNRSELAVGYTTLYGDMAGAYCVLKDVFKTFVYQLSTYRNQINAVIPQNIIDRPPTAELAPNQKDEDSLPPYPVLDKILYLYLNLQQGIEDIVAQGFSRDIVTKVVTAIHHSEYKRRQSPLGVRLDHTAFGRDRRYPVASAFKG